ncbi:MAG: ComF family protein [Deltaproteobacteria bacterium]|nr:ComF family protein [Deltaproteobacteria bacterium]MBW2417114.1 ComF family protein [Deltaproteobacteria bacterium]
MGSTKNKALWLWKGLVDLLLPPRCADCGIGIEAACSGDPLAPALCHVCRSRLDMLGCAVCALCQASPPATMLGETERCGACAGRSSPLAACLASVAYRGEAERWVHRFKYPGAGLAGLDPRARQVLSALIRDAASRAPAPPPQLVVPVPLHPRRLRERGFNPSALLARHLARSIGAVFSPAVLKRIRDTPSQTGLGRKARQLNVRGAFALQTDARLPPRVWIVDDVVTTGSTLAEVARELRRGGAHHLVAICVARTL